MNFYDILLARALCCKMGSEEVPLEVTENGQYIAPEGKAFNPVTVSVPLPSGTLPITENGIYNVYSYASVDVAAGISVDDIAVRSISGAIVGSSAPWIGSYAFAYCSSLTEVNFPACTSIGSYAFRGCRKLLSFNLAGVSSVPTLSGTSVFSSTPIGGYTVSTGGVYGSVYVPSSLLTVFQTAPNWSLIASDRFVGV